MVALSYAFYSSRSFMRSVSGFTTLAPSSQIITRQSQIQNNSNGKFLFMSTTTDTAAETAEQPKKKVKTSRILSGVQPTGSIHLGNYLGAIRQWVDFQNEEEDEEGNIKENFFCVVDLHAITMPHDPKELGENSLAVSALYIAAGKLFFKCLIFQLMPLNVHFLI